jgi:hypothetical protein
MGRSKILCAEVLHPLDWIATARDLKLCAEVPADSPHAIR